MSAEKPNAGALSVLKMPIPLKWLAVLVAGAVVVVLLIQWNEGRPKVLLKRFLNTEPAREITRLEGFLNHTGLDYTAHVYLEADPAFLKELMSRNGFAADPYDNDPTVGKLNFKGAPTIPHNSVISYSNGFNGSPVEKLVITRDGKRLWYAPFDY